MLENCKGNFRGKRFGKKKFKNLKKKKNGYFSGVGLLFMMFIPLEKRRGGEGRGGKMSFMCGLND